MLEDIALSDLGDRLGLNLDNVELRGTADALALSTAPLVGTLADEDNPILIMSTGIAADVILANEAGDQGTDLGLEGGVNDDIILSFDVLKEDADNFLSFDLTFLTEEFPEFLGADFNDFFSATINGQEVALDLNNAVFDVNNAFFDPDLATDGTQFDGRTATVRITTELDTGQAVNSVELRIADEGDGRLDSAAFLNNFALSSHTVFIDFDAGEANFDTLLQDGLTFATEASDLTPEDIDRILNGFPDEGDDPLDGDDDNVLGDEIILGVRDIFAGFAIEFVTQRPDFENYSTVHVGGRIEDLPEYLQANDSLFSLSEAIDLGNEDDRDEAIVLSDEALEITDLDVKVGLIAQAIARETAHLVGLRNVEDRQAVVFPTPGESRTDLTVVSPLAAVDDEGAVVSFPEILDITNELGDTIGQTGAAVVPTTPLSQTILRTVTIELGATTPTLNDVRIAAVDSDDNILELLALDELGAQDVVNLSLPLIDTDRLVLIASTEAGEAPDLFLSLGDTGIASLIGPSQADIFDLVGVQASDLQNAELQIAATDEADDLAASALVRTNISDLDVTSGGEAADSLEAEFLGGVLIGLGGADTLDGDIGSDGLYGGGGADLVSGGGGADDIRGGDGDDTLDGGDGDDAISGGAGADEISGGDGLDTIFAAAGDVVDGGADADVVKVEAAFADQTLSALEDGFLFVSDAGQLQVSDVEQFEFSDQTLSEADLEEILAPVVVEPEPGDPLIAGDDGEEIIGSDQPEIVTGGDGEDMLLSGDGADTVSGGSGDDSVDGGGGADSVSGGLGNDSLSGGEGADSVSGGEGDDELSGDDGGDTLRGDDGSDQIDGGAGRDRLIGGGGDDTLNGGGSDDTLNGGAGEDVLIGGFGADALRGRGGEDDLNGGGGRDDVRGGAGADMLRGGGGRDDIKGGGGADVINGGRGADLARGGGGQDIFQFKTGDGRDTIRDFRQGQDSIEILRGADNFSDLIIAQIGADVRISFSNVTIIVQTDNADNFTEADFIF